MKITISKLKAILKQNYQIMLVFFSTIIIYIIAAIFNNTFINTMSMTSYLTSHTLFEFANIIISFSIFTVAYFVYKEYGNLNMIIFSCTFLAMSLLDIFHTLSYKGMADFLIVNDTLNRSTTLWIISRVIGSLGFMLAVFISPDTISKIKKEYFALVTIVFSVGILLITTYFPEFFPPMFIEDQGLTTIKSFLECIVILIFIITFIKVVQQHKQTNSDKEYMYMIALILLILNELAFASYGTVYTAFNYIGPLLRFIAYFILYRSIYIENITNPYRELKSAKDKLKVYSDDLDVLVEKRTEELKDLNELLLADIEYAKEVQQWLLPEKMPENMFVSFDAEFLIAERLSGDFYNVIKLDEDNIAVYMGDVSGHGVSAAMLTVFANQNVIQLKEGEDSSGYIIEPSHVLKTIYNSFNETNISSEKYILMLYGIYNIKTKCFKYASAGINVPPYVIKHTGEIIEMNVKGLPICKLGGMVDPTYENITIQLETGDKILFYSDGLIEAQSKNKEEYGQVKLEQFLKENSSLSASELNSAIKHDFFEHIGFNEQLMDDTTLLVMELTN